MAASAHLLLSALSKQVPAQPAHAPAGCPLTHEAQLTGEPSLAHDVPLTSEPPLAHAAPLTSEPPLADIAPLTSEPTAHGTAGGAESPGA
ncbi:hypothetical protein HW130_19250 [Streptomyces sp. PKU-EA00015]|uniref:hypothetical protein n=1 Tax=Streptomyces sp. PKU-EA00015 TaxID=2748326 RepID=UPI0015A42DDA|nr:hypothetical protein [Streptomyces sp. PKU-EA00015]NWF28380.1 hypothetical protein [Streptomyces sp. PKU-EA00015]